jgi:hypothetical protein
MAGVSRLAAGESGGTDLAGEHEPNTKGAAVAMGDARRTGTPTVEAVLKAAGVERSDAAPRRVAPDLRPVGSRTVQGQAAGVAAKPKAPLRQAPDYRPLPKTSPEIGPRLDMQALIDANLSWLPAEAERRMGFMQLYRVWRSHVRAEYTEAATPAFLFLVSALPTLVDAREELKDLDLWEPLGERAHVAREAHPAWKRYCEFLPRAQAACERVENYRSYSLFTELDALHERVIRTERRYREGVAKSGR